MLQLKRVTGFFALVGLLAGVASAGTLAPGGVLSISFGTPPANPESVFGVLMGWGNLAAVQGSPTFTVKLYDGTSLLDTQLKSDPLNFFSWAFWTDTGTGAYGSAMASPTAIDIGPLNAGMADPRIEISLDQGAVSGIVTGNIQDLWQAHGFSWDYISIETISLCPPGPGCEQQGMIAPNINVGLTGGGAPEPATALLTGLAGAGLLALGIRRRRRG